VVNACFVISALILNIYEKLLSWIYN
jgi:hypothetical protein